jgi:hypothetical protein
MILSFAQLPALGAIAQVESLAHERTIGDPWLIMLLNLSALVIIVLAYVWAG